MCFSGVVRIALSLHLKAAAAAVSVEAVCFSSNTHTLSTLLISQVCSRKKVLLLLLLPFLVEETLTRVLVVLCLLALFFAVCVCVQGFFNSRLALMLLEVESEREVCRLRRINVVT